MLGHVAVSPSGSRVASFSAGENEFRIWDGRTAAPQLTIRTSAGLHALAWGNENRLAVALRDSTIRLHEGFNLPESARLTGHTSPVVRLAFSADGKRLASASEDGTVRVWALNGLTWTDLLTLKADGQSGLAFGRDGKVLIVAGLREVRALGMIEE
jgi:WD40 repeat protein